MRPELRDKKLAAIHGKGLRTLKCVQSQIEVRTGRRWHLDSVRLWTTEGRYGVVLPSDSTYGLVLVRACDVEPFLRRAGLLQDPVDAANAEDGVIALPAPPPIETSDEARQLDRLAILRSRRERLAAHEAGLASPTSSTTSA